MSRLYDLIQDYRGENPDAIIDIIEKFEPLLGKFQRNGSYEDIKSDLILFMFKLLDNIPLDKEVFKEDKYLVSYIYKSLQNQYIYLNKKNCKIVNKEMVIDEIKLNHSYYDCFNHIIFNDMIKNLTDSEKDILTKKYIFNYSESDIARIHNKTRQAIHQSHRRALKKLRAILEN